MGRREQENRKRKAAAKSCQSLDTWVSKEPRQEPDADNDSAVCDDSPAETTTSDLSQRDIEGKSYLFSQCPLVLKVYQIPYFMSLKTRGRWIYNSSRFLGRFINLRSHGKPENSESP